MMAYSHIAHDCQIHDGVILANGVQLGGHVVIEERVLLGGLAGAHQFVRIGKLAMIGAISKASQDILPFSISDGRPLRTYAINTVGLERAGISKETQRFLAKAFRLLLRSGLSAPNALEQIEKELPPSPELQYLIQFVRNSKRGFCGGVEGKQGESSSWSS